MTDCEEAAQQYPIPIPTDFKLPEDRDRWIIEHAQYFTVVHRVNHRMVRITVPTLPEAERRAELLLKENPRGRYLIYAVYQVYDCYVKSVMA